MLRKGLVAIGVIGLAVGLTIACGSFSAEDPVAPGADASDASDEGAFVVDTGAPTDARAPDSLPGCEMFDAAGAIAPSGDVTGYDCGGGAKNLTGDPQNCGWCGHVCTDTALCAKGVCQPFVLVTGPAGSSLQLERVDDTDVYWVDESREPSALFRASSSITSNQSAAALLVEVDAGEPLSRQMNALAFEPRIYIHTYTRLLVAPFDGGPLSVFSTTSAGNEITPLVRSGDHLFQTGYTGSGTFIDFLEADAAVLSKQTSVGGAYDLAATPDGRFAFYVGRKAVDAGAATRAALYRYEVATQKVDRVAVFDVTTAAASALVADDRAVYFPDVTGAILRLEVEAPPGTQPTVLSPGNGRKVGYMALDDRRVYWFSSPSAAGIDFDLWSVDKCGGGTFRHVANEAGLGFAVRGFRVHGTHLYWASRNVIYRVEK